MKFLKVFEEFRDFNLGFIDSKMEELSDIVSDYSNIVFEYNIESSSENSNSQGLLVIKLKATDASVEIHWNIDLDTPHISIVEIDADQSDETYSSDLSSVEEGLDVVEKHIYEIFEISERVKAQRYKGKKIPGKYLTKNPGKMKKEIDTFRGKKEYKKDWDADYTSGKGGKGKRVKTKKSASTKAYQRMFGDK